MRVPGHDGLGLDQRGRVSRFLFGEAFGRHAPHHQNGVAEAPGGDESGLGPRARDQCVVAAQNLGLKSEDELIRCARFFFHACTIGVADCVQGADGKIPRRRQGLADVEKALLVENHAVGKCPADIDANRVIHFAMTTHPCRAEPIFIAHEQLSLKTTIVVRTK